MANIFSRMTGSTVRWSGRQIANSLLRMAGQNALNAALRTGSQSALDAAVGSALDAVPKTGQQSYTQVFNVDPPLTVYVRASHCRVTVRRTGDPRVTLEATMLRAFGVELAAEQDDMGVYVVARRKTVVGQMARVDFTLIVPHDCHLAFNLTPGEVLMAGLDGLFELPAP